MTLTLVWSQPAPAPLPPERLFLKSAGDVAGTWAELWNLMGLPVAGTCCRFYAAALHASAFAERIR